MAFAIRDPSYANRLARDPPLTIVPPSPLLYNYADVVVSNMHE